MHVTIVGAGALGQLYGVRLSTVGVEVAFLVRPSRLQDDSAFVVEAQQGDRRHDRLSRPRRVSTVPEDTDLILVTVHFEQLLPSGAGAPLVETLRGSHAPIVVLSPMLSGGQEALEQALGRPVIAGMPGVAAYVDARGVVRFWSSPLTPTRLDACPSHPALAEASRTLGDRLGAADLPTLLRPGLGATNTALTVAFFPWIAAILPARGVLGLARDRALLQTTREAFQETLHLGRRLGLDSATWALGSTLGRVGSEACWSVGLRLGGLMAPGLLAFLDHHFGPKLRAQHLALGQAVLELGRERALAMPSTQRLLERVEVAGAAAS